MASRFQPAFLLLLTAVISSLSVVAAFTAPSNFLIDGSRSTQQLQQPVANRHDYLLQPASRKWSTSLNVLGGDGGILGVGAPEIAVTLIVGYFVLGPSDLYKLVKEIGKFIQNFRTLGAEAAKSFEGTMENQLDLEELRKAQAELSDAFNFRRSINTDKVGDNFDANNFAQNSAAEVAVGGAAVASTTLTEESAPVRKKKRLVRRKKKRVVEAEEEAAAEEAVRDAANEYPDLDMSDAELSNEEKLRSERLDRLSISSGDNNETKSGEPDWFTASEEDIASSVLHQQEPPKDPSMKAYEKQRFQSQLTADDWNAQIMSNEDALSPLSMVMKRLAILEEEKNTADELIEEEYQRKLNNEDKYYLEKRRVLEDAVTDIQTEVYGGPNGDAQGKESADSPKV